MSAHPDGQPLWRSTIDGAPVPQTPLGALDESPARQGFRRLQLLDELEGRGGALIPLVELERLQAIRRRALDLRDDPTVYEGSRANVIDEILGEDG